MTGYDTYADLYEGSVPHDGLRSDSAERLRRAMIATLELAQIQDGLRAVEGWRLSPAEVRELRRRAVGTPPGGWSSLVNLMAGCGFFSAETDIFRPNIAADDLLKLPARRLQKRAVEAFTNYLAPPQVAAALFIAMGIHPIWGLRVANEVQCPYRPASPIPRIFTQMMPDGYVRGVRKMVFGVLSTIMAALRRLPPRRAYPETAMVALIEVAVASVREGIVFDKPDSDTLELFNTDLSPTLAHVASAELWDMIATQVLVAAGLVERLNTLEFVIDSKVLQDIEVDCRDSEAQAEWLECLLNSEAA